MGKIKGWTKTINKPELTEYQNFDGYVFNKLTIVGSKYNPGHELQIWNTNGINSATQYSNKKQAVNDAVKFMKKNPRG